MTVDIARLTAAKEKGITQALDDETINALLPAEYRDPEGHWFGVTKRARVVYASKDRVKDTAITYADLADPEVEGQDLHALGPARLQSGAVLGGDRALGRGEDRGVAEGPQGQSRPRSRTAATGRRPARSRPANATSRSATPTMSG